jgi:hypothetical protein
MRSTHCSAVSALRESAVGRSFAQDLPFFVLSTILLIRTVNRKDDAALLSRFCSAEYDTRSFILLFLNTMKTAGMLATKLVKLKSLPSIWSKRLKLQAEQGKLAQRVARLESAEMAALASAAPADDDACAESPQGAAPADNGSAQPPEHRCTVAVGPASDAGSSSTASLPLVSLSVRFTESAFGEGGVARVSRSLCMCRDRVRASDHATMPEPPSAAQRSSERGQRRPASPPRLHGRCARGAMIRLPTRSGAT